MLKKGPTTLLKKSPTSTACQKRVIPLLLIETNTTVYWEKVPTVLLAGKRSQHCCLSKEGHTTTACQERVPIILLVKTGIVWVAFVGAFVGNWWLRWWIRWQRAYWLYRAQLVAPFFAWLEMIGFALVSWVVGTNRHFLPLFLSGSRNFWPVKRKGLPKGSWILTKWHWNAPYLTPF